MIQGCAEILSVVAYLHHYQVEKFEEDTLSPPNKTGSAELDTDQEAWPKALSYHVRGPVNQVYSEILLSRLCPRTRN